LIELKDGDTIIIYGNADYMTKDYYSNMAEAMTRGLKDVKVFMASAAQDSIVVYRASPSATVEEHDGWHPWETAPRDGQEIDVWIEPRGRVPEVYFEHDGFFYYDEGDKTSLTGRFGTPSHWRYPPQGPKA